MRRNGVVVFALAWLLAIGVLAQADVKTTIKTPKDTPVPAIRITKERLSWKKIEAIRADAAQAFPNAIELRRPTYLYNCHSYAWHSQTSPNDIWLDEPNQMTYWTDGSYEEVDENDPGPGIRVQYAADDHSAIKLYNNHFVSKWGS